MRILAFALLLAAAPAAHAADLATLDCVVEKLDAATRTALDKDVERNLAESGKRPSYDPATVAGIQAAAETCAKENKWSEFAVKAARIYAIAKVGWPIAQRVLGEKGFDAALLETQFLTLPEEQRNRPLTAEEMQQLVRDSVTEEAQQTRENAELVGEFFQFANTMQYASYDFSQA
jgi:hypothetical protein